MSLRPSIKIDWDGGEASFHPGERLLHEDPIFQIDVLDDISLDVIAYKESALNAAFPGLQERWQRQRNGRRREIADSLMGETIRFAKALPDGSVMLQVASGRTVLFRATEVGDVDLSKVDPPHLDHYSRVMQSAHEYRFTEEPHPGERERNDADENLASMFNRSL
jgi:hypothetical protein